ncbi:hypothetical protein VB735_16710 [Halotia wernerae UHCC 0503]|nr:hypothetical protein [Halotia wernerae UHCC 0503]
MEYQHLDDRAIAQVKLAEVDLQAQIQVSDTGKGITVTFLPYVFDIFQNLPDTL